MSASVDRNPGGRGSRARASGQPTGDAFPWIVALFSLLLGLAVYIHSTRPALTERDALEAAERRLRASLRAEVEALRSYRARATTLRDNPEHVLTELDAQGISARAADRAAERLSTPPPGGGGAGTGPADRR